MSINKKELIKTVQRFRMFELRSFLMLNGQKPNGRKKELQNRALELLNEPSDFVVSAVRKIFEETSIRKKFLCTTENCSLNTTKSCSAKSTSEIPCSSETADIGMDYQNLVPDSQSSHHRSVNFIFQFRKLLLYDELSVLLNPTLITNVQGANLIFYVGSKEFDEIDQDNQVQVLLRFGYVETDRQEKEQIPVSLNLKVNSMIICPDDCQNKIKTLKSPQNITNLLIKRSGVPQVVNLSWCSNLSKQFLIGVFLIRKRSVISLIENLTVQSVQDPIDTYIMIEKMYYRDSEITFLDPSTSLLCPLTKTKIVTPCRSRICNHVQCFDAASHITMNQAKSNWTCPICRKSAEYNDLIIDGLILEILQKAPPDCTKVRFSKDRTWIPVDPKKKSNDVQLPSNEDPCPILKKSIEVITIDSDTDEENTVSVQLKRKKPCNHLVLSNTFMVNDMNDPGFVLKQIFQPCNTSSSQPIPIAEDKTGNQCKATDPHPAIWSPPPIDHLHNVEDFTDKLTTDYRFNYAYFTL